MALNSNAMTTVDDLLSYMGESLPASELFSIYHDESDSATAATVRISGALILTITGGANAGVEVLALSSYASVTALVAAALALDKGWVATVEGGSGSADPANLDALITVSAFGSAAIQYPTGRNTHAYEHAINVASTKIENHCSRTFIATDYTHMYCGRDEKRLPLRQYPIIRVDRVAIGRTDAFKVRNTSTDASLSTFALESAQARLEVVGGANNSSSTVAYTSSTTLTTFVAAIIAEGNGWEAEVLSSAEGTWLVADCLDFDARNTEERWLTVFTPQVNQDRYDVHKEAGAIERSGWGQSIIALGYGTGGWLRHSRKPLELRPLTAEEGGSFWPEGRFNVYVKYRAGFETLPDDVVWVCQEFAKNLLQNAPRNTALSAESVEGYSWTAGSSSARGAVSGSGGEDAWTQSIKRALAPRVMYITPDFIEV